MEFLHPNMESNLSVFIRSDVSLRTHKNLCLTSPLKPDLYVVAQIVTCESTWSGVVMPVGHINQILWNHIRGIFEQLSEQWAFWHRDNSAVNTLLSTRCATGLTIMALSQQLWSLWGRWNVLEKDIYRVSRPLLSSPHLLEFPHHTTLKPLKTDDKGCAATER